MWICVGKVQNQNHLNHEISIILSQSCYLKRFYLYEICRYIYSQWHIIVLNTSERMYCIFMFGLNSGEMLR